MKPSIVICNMVLLVFLVSCGGGEDKKTFSYNAETGKMEDADKASATATTDASKPSKGIGEIKEVQLSIPLDGDMVTKGKAIAEMKCTGCHSLGANRIVGPGWLGLTTKRTPEWIMNMVTNVDVMLEKDPEAQKLLELCLVKMPNQSLSVADTRSVLEFMRQNDGVK